LKVLAMPDFEDDAPTSEANFDRLLRESSLGSPAARHLRNRVGDDQLERVRRLLSAGAAEDSTATNPVDSPATLPVASDAGGPALEADPGRGEYHTDESHGSASGQPGARQFTWGAPVLSERELQVLQLMATGRTVRQIAEELSLSAGSVEHLISRVRLAGREAIRGSDRAEPDLVDILLAMQHQRWD
jgi:DNA-binding CsgD family transcriptional regulator